MRYPHKYGRAIFYTQLLPELKNKGKTVLVISHDDRYFHLAERIVKLEDGKLESLVLGGVIPNSKNNVAY